MYTRISRHTIRIRAVQTISEFFRKVIPVNTVFSYSLGFILSIKNMQRAWRKFMRIKKKSVASLDDEWEKEQFTVVHWIEDLSTEFFW